ncbi:MAG: hypothetical protein HQ596_05835 [Candidatus Saganbacteria bacterium]|nr:hypothetical protein [Candidatus Saganbacteria bacterium]
MVSEITALSQMGSSPDTRKMNEIIVAASHAQTQAARESIKDEFMVIFYREVFKQAFKTPNFSGDDKDNDFLSSRFGSDMFVNKLALELVKSKTFSAENVFPTFSKAVEVK